MRFQSGKGAGPLLKGSTLEESIHRDQEIVATHDVMKSLPMDFAWKQKTKAKVIHDPKTEMTVK